jgi:hypothetical protein
VRRDLPRNTIRRFAAGGCRVSVFALTTNSDIYKATLVLHILCAIIGFGAVFLNGLYGNEMKKRRGPESLAIYEANYKVSKVGEYFIYAVFLLGLALVGMANKEWKFSQTWVWLAIALYIVALGISHGVLFPAVKRMGVLMREMIAAGPPATPGPPPQAAEMEALGKRLAAAGATLNVMLVIIIVLMVFKPGAPGFGF